MNKRIILRIFMLVSAVLTSLNSFAEDFTRTLESKYIKQRWQTSARLPDQVMEEWGFFRATFNVSGVNKIEEVGEEIQLHNYFSIQGYADINDNITIKIACETPDIKRKSDGKYDVDNLSITYDVSEYYGGSGESEDRLSGEADKENATITIPLKDVVKTDNTDLIRIRISVTSRASMVDKSIGKVKGYAIYKEMVLCSNEAYITIKVDGSMNSAAPPTYEEDNEASDEGGIWKYIIPPFVGGCLIGWWRKRRKNKKQQKDDDSEPEPEEEEDDEPDQLQMQVYKNFGDTLLVGDKGQQVNALIVRKPKKGPEYVDENLTRQIQIMSGDDYLHVEMGDIENGWKTALRMGTGSREPASGGNREVRVGQRRCQLYQPPAL